MKKPKSNAPHSGVPFKERIADIFSPVLLILSLIILTFAAISDKIRLFLRSFAYRRLRRPLAAVGGFAESIRQSRVQCLCIFSVLILFIPMISNMSLAVAVTIDGHTLGYVRSEEEIVQALETIESSTAEVLGEAISVTPDITYEVSITTTEHILDAEELPAMVAESIEDLQTLAVLKIDDETFAICRSTEEAQEALDRVLANHTAMAEDEEGEISASFLQDVKIESVQAPLSIAISGDALYEELTSTVTAAQIHIATDTDTLSGIAQQYGMVSGLIYDLNPEIIPTRMAPGTEVVIAAEVPLLSVQVSKTVTYTEAIPFETISRTNTELANNKTNTLQPGVTGEREVEATILLIDGIEQERTILSQRVLSEPTEEIIEVGTKKTGVGSGNLRYPITGATITSRYGYRWGRMHQGVDFGVSTGTTVRAADDGKVIVAGYSTSGYGYYVIIDHQNGMKTLYAHNSSLTVNVGDIVDKGDRIALSGNTGNSTGPHLHFEVMIYDENVNPLTYLP